MSKEDKLKLLEEKAEKVATLSKRDMTELKSFGNPPTAIVDVLGATLKLLGEENTIADYDPDDVPDDKRAEAKKTLSQYDFEKVNRISVFTAVVYAWHQMVLSKETNCYIFALSLAERQDVHTDAGMTALETLHLVKKVNKDADMTYDELKLVNLLTTGTLTTVSKDSLDHHLVQACGRKVTTYHDVTQ
ncbi:hypothetical protein MAR_038246 [Mya arenaria]|uniref:Dynein heavy chain coiled coil stalk domain-containing protein n=1 Tax=Mya arenaria TaxID=6604 RepID=A0ABY7FQZ3_MYAAR|nr:hypothetical protein MAR_038246 [Mya arenaria]